MKRILCGLAFIGLAACGNPEVIAPAPVTVTHTETRTVLPPPPPLPTTTKQCIHNVNTGWPVDEAMHNWNQNGKNLLVNYLPGMQDCTYHISVHTVPNLADRYGTTTLIMQSSTVILLSEATPRNLRLSVACHELGHALGVPHSTEDGSCMRNDDAFPALPTWGDLQTLGKKVWEWGSANDANAVP